jgi:hypothetical protein
VIKGARCDRSLPVADALDSRPQRLNEPPPEWRKEQEGGRVAATALPERETDRYFSQAELARACRENILLSATKMIDIDERL